MNRHPKAPRPRRPAQKEVQLVDLAAEAEVRGGQSHEPRPADAIKSVIQNLRA